MVQILLSLFCNKMIMLWNSVVSSLHMQLSEYHYKNILILNQADYILLIRHRLSIYCLFITSITLMSPQNDTTSLITYM